MGMDRDTMVARMQQKLGFRTDRTTECQNALQDVQDELERGGTLPFFLQQLDQTFTITPAVPKSATPQEYNLPVGFIRDVDEQDGTLRYQKASPGPQVFLEKMDYKNAELRFYGKTVVTYDQGVVIVPSEDTQFSPGTPVAYVVRTNKIRIYPGPDITYNLLWSYYAHDTPLNGSNVTNQWSTYAPYLLIGKAGMLVAGDMRDADAYGLFSKIVFGDPQIPGDVGALKQYLAFLFEREESGRTYAMGSRL
jgi:hypothetical protein